MGYEDQKLYWYSKSTNKYIRIDEIDERHLFNIVCKYGTDWLNDNGYCFLTE